ncbi:transcriptional regulator [Psychrobacter immobilis]|uniref:transcriptional regulator n=1 Tax=Psychrobacter immobilis TaxID=498 RepID=UPI0019186A39|nr:transcriptional regulator [Psychrobacter immobilis]
MHYSWDVDRAEGHIDKLCDSVKDVEIVPYTREMSLGNIPVNKAYEMDAVHIYVDILNLEDLLTKDGNENETSHKRAIRFFDSHFRTIRYILDESESLFVDFHNQRLHAVVTKPYDNEKKRLDRAVALSDLIIDAVAQQKKDSNDSYIDAATIRVGIDSGIALAVNNGRAKNKEPLFLGNPANHAAKHAAGDKKGIYLTTNARDVLELSKVAADKTKTSALTSDEIKLSVDRTTLPNGLSLESVNKNAPEPKLLKDFQFSRAASPLEDFDFNKYYYKTAKRQELVSLYADIDGFTNYVNVNIGSEQGKKNIVRCLHVIRSEMDDCINTDFKGKRVRFIGDCMHAIICEGSNKYTDRLKTVEVGTEASGGIRSSFNLSLEKLNDRFGIQTDDLGLAIGYELGDVSNLRVGQEGVDNSTRFSLGISTIASEKEQMQCEHETETRIGKTAFGVLEGSKYEDLFSDRSATDITFERIEEVDNEAIEEDTAKNESAMYDDISYSVPTPSDEELISSRPAFKPHAQFK